MITLDEPDLDNDIAFQQARAYVATYLGRQPRSRPAEPAIARVGLIQDVQANTPWLISSYGENLALGFKGDPDFIERCYNWATNTGVIGKGARLNWYYERITGRLAYVCPKNVDVILAGLKLQFRAEIIMAHEVSPLHDRTQDDDWEGEGEMRIGYDEDKIDSLAAQRADAFMRDHVIRDSFVLDKLTQTAPIYSLGTLLSDSDE